ncbi:hypothetical protein RRG08_000489 [Elysia crispata]|uniref:Uncharacterized protein n=1 Tax=Elysia crispata TaxID=231223 RepID=A0AAE0YCH9_9GAST|nr:hypothetical protein RRG08_000489 [Elysia crispata]
MEETKRQGSGSEVRKIRREEILGCSTLEAYCDLFNLGTKPIEKFDKDEDVDDDGDSGGGVGNTNGCDSFSQWFWMVGNDKLHLYVEKPIPQWISSFFHYLPSSSLHLINPASNVCFDRGKKPFNFDLIKARDPASPGDSGFPVALKDEAPGRPTSNDEFPRYLKYSLSHHDIYIRSSVMHQDMLAK